MRKLLGELIQAIQFFTRLPVGWTGLTSETSSLAQVAWAWPVTGALVGVLAGTVYVAAAAFGWPPMLASLASLAAAVLVTGALHEDGLADTADAFGGGVTVERRLSIMRDSRIGTYGTISLIVTFLMRVYALASMEFPATVLAALIVAGTLSRGALLLIVARWHPARSDGLAFACGMPGSGGVLAGLGISLLAALVFGADHIFYVVGITVVVALVMGWLAERKIGGYTGDVLGATVVSVETLILIVFAISS